MSKQSTLAAGLKQAAAAPPQAASGAKNPAKTVATGTRRRSHNNGEATVLIGGHFAPEVRRVLLLVQAEPENAGRSLKQLLGEAINDLCAKYRKPQPYNGEE